MHNIPLRKRITIIILGVAAVAVALYILSGKQQDEAPTACTEEARVCLDGSTVGRTGPNCAFAECPEGTGTEDWKEVTDSTSGAVYKYPENFNTIYIDVLDWPPEVRITDGPFACGEGGEADARAGETVAKTINSRAYCVTTSVEGAAGSTYTRYAYAFQKDNQTAIFTFSTRAVQCANYDDPERTACEAERQTFTIDGIIDRMAQTVVIR